MARGVLTTTQMKKLVKACLECENEYMNKGTTPDYYIRPSYVVEVIV